MGFAGFMSEIDDDERDRGHVAICEKCGKLLTMSDWWKIGGKNLCKKHGEAYAKYLES